MTEPRRGEVMDTSYHSRLLGRAQQVASWSLRRFLGRRQRDPHDSDSDDQQQQQQQGQGPHGAADNFAPDWRGIRQGWPAGVTCSHLTESWFAADDGAVCCCCGGGEAAMVEEEENEENEDERRNRHVEEVARHTLAEMLRDAVPFALSDGTASGRADPRVVRAARARLLRAFDEDVAGEGGDAFGIRRKQKKKKKKKETRDIRGGRQKRTEEDGGEGAAYQQQMAQKQHRHQPRQPRTFHMFPDLPAELRLEIWSLALRQRSRGLGVGVVRGWRYNWHADVPRPALAGVCREARDVVLSATVAGAATGLTIHDRLDLGNSPDGRRLAGLLGCVGRLRGGVVLGLNHFLGRGQAIQDDGLLGLDLARLAGGRGGAPSLGAVLREVLAGGSAVLVTVQTVYVTLGSGTAAREGPGGGGGGVEGYLQRLQAVGEFDNVEQVDVGPGQGSRVDEAGNVDAGAYWRQMIPHEACHHVTEVVPLGDAAAMRRILAVGEATGQWHGGRRPRLLALGHHSHAFCLDKCLGEWWERCGRQTVRAGMERVMRADADEEEEEELVLPEVVPAVRFKIQWPGLQPPKIVDGEVCWDA